MCSSDPKIRNTAVRTAVSTAGYQSVSWPDELLPDTDSTTRSPWISKALSWLALAPLWCEGWPLSELAVKLVRSVSYKYTQLSIRAGQSHFVPFAVSIFVRNARVHGLRGQRFGPGFACRSMEAERTRRDRRDIRESRRLLHGCSAGPGPHLSSKQV